MEFNEKIKALREGLGLTLEQVGNAVGVGKSTVRKWETGDIANMRRDKIAKLAEALHTSPAYLMGWEADPDVEAALLATVSDRAKSGCFDAENKMFGVFGENRDSLSLRIVGSKFAVLFYHPFGSRDSAGRAMEILGMLRELSQDELLAVAGMLRGFVNRKDLEDC